MVFLMNPQSQSRETKDASFDTEDAGFATKCENLFACIKYFSLYLVAADYADLRIIRQ